MARYIDADKVHEGIEAIQTSLKSNNDEIWRINKPYYKGLAIARGVINETPTADVAPRAEVDFLKKTIEEVENAKREVAKEIFEEIESEIVVALNSNYRAIAEHQEKYGDNVNLNFLTACYAKSNALRGMEAFVEDLKKKYVEGQK